MTSENTSFTEPDMLQQSVPAEADKHSNHIAFGVKDDVWIVPTELATAEFHAAVETVNKAYARSKPIPMTNAEAAALKAIFMDERTQVI